MYHWYDAVHCYSFLLRCSLYKIISNLMISNSKIYLRSFDSLIVSLCGYYRCANLFLRSFFFGAPFVCCIQFGKVVFCFILCSCKNGVSGTFSYCCCGVCFDCNISKHNFQLITCRNSIIIFLDCFETFCWLSGAKKKSPKNNWRKMDVWDVEYNIDWVCMRNRHLKKAYFI